MTRQVLHALRSIAGRAREAEVGTVYELWA